MTDTANATECGLGIRGVAIGIDAVVWFGLFFAAVFPIAALTGQIESGASGVNADLTGTPASVAFLLWLALALSYHSVLEYRYGKTVGKHLVGIRVASADGTAVSFRTAVVRNLARLVDWLPSFYLVGVVTVVTSERNQRLGDRLGGTVVRRK